MDTETKPEPCAYCNCVPRVQLNPATHTAFIRCEEGVCYSVAADVGVSAPDLETALDQWSKLQATVREEKLDDQAMREMDV